MAYRAQWVLASSNAGKLSELNSLLAPLSIQVSPQSAFDVPDATEDGVAFIDNALIKARQAARMTGLPAIADDSGLAVEALGGAPGIHSARFAGTHGDDRANNDKLLQALKNTPEDRRGAAFHCCLVVTRSDRDPVPLIAHGLWPGTILTHPRGTRGFGYDPLFWVESDKASAAELSAARKNHISHRAQAMQSLLAQIHAHF